MVARRRVDHAERSATGRLVARAIAVALAFLTIELLLRFYYYVPLEIDPRLGYVVVRPGTAAVYRREGGGVSHWTTRGIRRASLPDRDVAPILVLGDSFTEALMIDDADVYTDRLERLLTRAGIDIPILNAGRSGASPADYVGYAPAYRSLFAPRWVVVQLSDQDMGDDAWRPEKVHFERGADGALSARVPPARGRGRLWRAY